MRFNSEAYAKLYPQTEPVQPVESAVETFRPSEASTEEQTIEETAGLVEQTVETEVVEDGGLS